jgi:membrane protein implicated in regulation of membrane protease activity
MQSYWIWWLAAIGLVVAEMFSGTFYLLAVATGLCAAGIAAYLGVAENGQALIAALLCTASVVALYFWKRKATQSAQSNFAYDIGQTVRIAAWTDARHARVHYRGAEWDAKLSSQATSDSAREVWRIKEIVGSLLIIE